MYSLEVAAEDSSAILWKGQRGILDHCGSERAGKCTLGVPEEDPTECSGWVEQGHRVSTSRPSSPNPWRLHQAWAALHCLPCHISALRLSRSFHCPSAPATLPALLLLLLLLPLMPLLWTDSA